MVKAESFVPTEEGAETRNFGFGSFNVEVGPLEQGMLDKQFAQPWDQGMLDQADKIIMKSWFLPPHFSESLCRAAAKSLLDFNFPFSNFFDTLSLDPIECQRGIREKLYVES